MVHRYNERVFARTDTDSALVHSYLVLVGIELSLKNNDAANWSSGHQIDLMIASLRKPALQALVLRVNTILDSLWCEQKGGGAARVNATNYPHVRYLRHASDFGGKDASSDAVLSDLRGAVDDLAAEMRREGILA